jgi:RNA polymerase sigma-70 factor (ECF subfamily)
MSAHRAPAIDLTAIYGPELPRRLEVLWQQTGAPALQALLHGEPSFTVGALATARQREDVVLTTLMAAFQQSGDGDVFALLYEVYAPELQAAARRLVGRPAVVEADDAVQEAFLNMARYPKGFVPDRADALRRWSYRILRNGFFSLAKRHGRQPGELPEAVDEWFADERAASPLQCAERAEAATACRRAYVLYLARYAAAFAELREKDRTLLTLAEVDGVSYREIAARLGLTVAGVKVGVFRARKRIADRIGVGGVALG